jgi:predicted SAM-dependent methyltransferase
VTLTTTPEALGKPTLVHDRIWLNIGCGTHRAPAPWWNIDTVRRKGEGVPPVDVIDPDQIIDPDQPLPFEDGSCDRVLMSHVLEHVPWEAVPDILTDVRRIAQAELLVVGPDVYRCIESYRRGKEPWSLMQTVLEHKDYPDDMREWPGAPHHWNCHEARVIEALNRTGWHAQPVLATSALQEWPLVGWNPNWQFAVVARSDGRPLAGR